MRADAKKALITGITGQDGSYVGELLYGSVFSRWGHQDGATGRSL